MINTFEQIEAWQKARFLFVHFFARSKETNQRKGAQQLGLRLPSRNARTRGF
jgi:hypothetical protein